MLLNYLEKYDYCEDLVTEYSAVLMRCTGIYEKVLVEKALLILKQLAIRFPKYDMVVRYYANGLNYYQHEQDQAEAVGTELEYMKLVSDFPNNLSLQKTHASHLQAGIGKVSAEKAAVILDEFISLVDRYSEEKWIQKAYISAMNSFVYRNKVDNEELVLSIIEKHAKRFIENFEIQEVYTNFLVNSIM